MKKQALIFFVISFLAAVILFTLALKVVLYTHAKNELKTLKLSNRAKVENAHSVLDASFERAVAEVRTIANTPAVRALIENNNPAQRYNVQQLFLAFSQQQKIFNQIRFLDVQGQEVVRVDSNHQQAYAIPEDQLQNKKDRYYFQDAMALKAGEVFISPLDLNVENNKIEIPYNPMIRFAMPVFNQSGEKRGIVIVNLFGEMMLNRYRTIMNSQTDNQSMLVDQDGNWLVAPDPKLEWGFMFGRPAEFAKQHPALWKKLSQHESGQYSNDDGLYTYSTLYPLDWMQQTSMDALSRLPNRQQNLDNHDYFWKIISFRPNQLLPSAKISNSHKTLTLYITGLLLLLLLTAYISYVAAARQQLRREISSNNRQHKQILNNLGEGVAVLDKQGIVIEANPEARKLLGWDKEEIIGHEAHRLFHVSPGSTEVDVFSQCPINSVTLTGQTYRNQDEVFYRKDKTQLSVGVVTTPLTTEEQEIIGAVLSFRDMTEIKAFQEKILQLAYHDTLTNLPNRRMLQDRIALALGLAQRNQRKFAIIFIDLDKFKAVNDDYGHDVGDELLKWVANKLALAVRDIDTVSRQGGDEFVVLLSEMKTVDNAHIVARKVLTHITQEPANILGHLLAVQVSIGIAVYPDHGMNVDELMQAADSAMYLAKRTGSNHYCIFGADVQSL